MNLFYIPCPDRETAHQIAKVLLECKLIGCANIIPGMESIYSWQGQIETSTEYILILKAPGLPDAQMQITDRVKELHPYKIPCIMTLPVLGINKEYEKWLEESCQ